MAQSAIQAKHRLKDLPLALGFARDLTRLTSAKHVPAWARDMTFIILEEMGELEAAQFVIGGLLADGQITDPHEFRFLTHRLELLKQGATVSNGGD